MSLIWKIIATYPGEQAKRGSRKVYKKECLENPIFKYYREKLDTYDAKRVKRHLPTLHIHLYIELVVLTNG